MPFCSEARFEIGIETCAGGRSFLELIPDHDTNRC
jgi:hypothetical protein